MLSKKITKYDLIEAVYQNLDYEKGLIQKVMEALMEELKKSIAKGCTIELRGFGTFEARLRKAAPWSAIPKPAKSRRCRRTMWPPFAPGRN